MNSDIVQTAQALERGDTTTLAARLQALFPRDARAAKAREFVAAVLSSPAAIVPIGREQPFLDNIDALIGSRVAPARSAFARNSMVIGEDLDFLGERGSIEAWSIAQALNFLLMRRLSPRKRCAVVVSMRDDGVYILQWLAHYLVLGVDRIFVYTNDNQDGSEVLLRLLAAHDIITLVENKTSGAVSPQGKAFEHALHLLPELRDYEWVFFLDSDEYFVPAAKFGHSIERVVAAADERHPHHPPSALCFNWLMFVSGMAYRRVSGLLLERFQHAYPDDHVKSLVRLRDTVSMRALHAPDTFGENFLVDSDFDPIKVVACRAPLNYSGGRLNHYWGRSFEEFSVKKARGDALKIADFRRDFDSFFLFDGRQQDDNRWPTDPALAAAVRRRIAELMELSGVRAAAAAVENEYASLIARYTAHAGLVSVYEQLQRRHARCPGPAS